MPRQEQRLISFVNQYRGINAHLHSHFLHAETEGWEEFHSSYITDLTRALNAQLPDMGYIARQERSLQIRHFDQTSAPVSDVLISAAPGKVAPARPYAATGASFALNVPALTLLERDPAEAKRPFAIKIYEAHLGNDALREKPVAWIELLSPSNKSGAGHASYSAKREALLANWLVFIEIDYLHGVSTTLERIPDYRASGRNQPPREDAYPYHLWLIDPRLPPDDDHSAAIAAFAVDEPIPSLTIPLNHGDAVTCDFNAVYHQTFRAQPAFGMAVNYAAAPLDWASDYNTRDQQAIAARMLTVQQARRDGLSLNDGPYPPDAAILERLRQRPELVQRVLSGDMDVLYE